MKAISDQSTMTLWPSWVWALLFIAAAAVLVMVVTRSMHERSHARRTPSPAHPANRAQCDVTGCAYPASQWRRAISVNGPDELRHTCKGCADEGEAFGWFTTADDLDTIEAYANRGDVA